MLSFRHGAHQLLGIFLTGRSPRTLDAYRADLNRFSNYTRVGTERFQRISLLKRPGRPGRKAA